MLQEELDSLKNKLEEQRNNGDFNIKSMTQEIVRMTEVDFCFLPVVLCYFTSFMPNVEKVSRFDIVHIFVKDKLNFGRIAESQSGF